MICPFAACPFIIRPVLWEPASAMIAEIGALFVGSPINNFITHSPCSRKNHNSSLRAFVGNPEIFFVNCEIRINVYLIRHGVPYVDWDHL